MAKTPESFAPGIPKKERIVPIPTLKKPATWKFGLQHHMAERAGPHFDLRLGGVGGPFGYAHSWQIQSMPAPGEKVLANQQPTHENWYMPFQGRINKGYGKGDVKRIHFEPTEVVHADPNRITFHLHRGHGTEEYTLVRWTGKNAPSDKAWSLYNHTVTRSAKPDLPSSKPNYREIPFEKVPERMQKPEQAMAAKIDGGHNTFLLETGKRLRIFSYRPTERTTGLIEHTHRVPKAYATKIPKQVGGTILRGELYARDKKTGKPLPSQLVGGLLNANVWLSRERQKVHGPLRAAIFDVVKWRGKNVEKAPYAQKMEILKEVKRYIPWMEIPETAVTPAQKQKLLKKIVTGKHPQTREGVVFWDLTRGTPPTKSKITEEHDVIVKGFQPGAGRLKGRGIGAVLYGTTQAPKEVKGRVGSGFSLSLREHMHKNPELYKGKVMKVKAQGAFPSGALRSPSFIQMHVDHLEGGEKVARRVSRQMRRYGLYAARSSDDVLRIVRRRLKQQKEEKRREKRAYGQGDGIRPGPTGFYSEPMSSLPTSMTDNQGRLRTNDEPDASPVIRGYKSTEPKKRSAKGSRGYKGSISKLFTNEDQGTRGYQGAEPLGTNREFHENHETMTPG